ncbi:MAG: UDP-N-acetylglucosamine 2-epimerase (hydrolyzing) [Gammaproteobacteria bacterium]|nr:UDP-N-acetylglucosamine 2-epimerase (hydrolyzing) [Gammaproteobacteria bacterium]
MKRKICIVTGTRAEYSLLKPLIELFNNENHYDVQLIATCMHLSHEFGLTATEIENDQLPIADKIEMLLNSDTACAISKSIGIGVMSFADSLRRLEPDLLLVVGDRFETLSVVIPAFMMKIPIIHLHGGETTEGAFDEGIRHSITKMSHLHFTSTALHRRRVIQLGEDPDRVFNVGAIGVENIKKLVLIPRAELERQLDFNFLEKNILVTFHPVTLEKSSSEKHFNNLLSVLDQYKQLGIIFTKANADPDGKIINSMIDKFVHKNSTRAQSYISMGHEKYLSAMNYVDAVVGNSSSGIIETPSLKKGTINIGDRQAGRSQATSIINCPPEAADIEAAFEKLFSHDFQARLKDVVNPYEGQDTSKTIYNHIHHYPFAQRALKKKFYDVQF